MELPKGNVNVQFECPVITAVAARRSVNESSKLDIALSYNPDIKLEDIKSIWILSALKHFNGSKVKAYTALGMSKETFYRFLRTHRETK